LSRPDEGYLAAYYITAAPEAQCAFTAGGNGV
jgi:hypothetical protein